MWNIQQTEYLQKNLNNEKSSWLAFTIKKKKLKKDVLLRIPFLQYTNLIPSHKCKPLMEAVVFHQRFTAMTEWKKTEKESGYSICALLPKKDERYRRRGIKMEPKWLGMKKHIRFILIATISDWCVQKGPSTSWHYQQQEYDSFRQ